MGRDWPPEHTRPVTHSVLLLSRDEQRASSFRTETARSAAGTEGAHKARGTWAGCSFPVGLVPAKGPGSRGGLPGNSLTGQQREQRSGRRSRVPSLRAGLAWPRGHVQASSRWQPECRGRGDERPRRTGICSQAAPGNKTGAGRAVLSVWIPQVCACLLLSGAYTKCSSKHRSQWGGDTAPDSSPAPRPPSCPRLGSTLCGGSSELEQRE